MDKATFVLIAAVLGVGTLLMPDNAFRKPEAPISTADARSNPLASDSAHAYISARADLSHGRMTVENKVPLSFRLQLKAPPKEAGARPPMDIVIVVDRSGSMETDNRIVFARRGVIEAINQLTPRDRVAVVAFGSQVQLLSSLRPVAECKQEVERIVANLKTEGGTFLSGGIDEAARVLRESSEAGRAKQILLLSDGHANEGLIGDELSPLGQKLGSEGIIITALGVGHDYDASTFIKLADGSGGGYAWVTMADRIPNAIRGELARAGDRVIDDMRIVVKPAAGVTVVRAYKHSINSIGNTVEIIAPTLAANEIHGIIVDLEVSAVRDRDPKIPIAEIVVSYTRAGEKESLELALVSQQTRDPRVMEASANFDVIAERETLGADMAWAASADDVASGNYDGAAAQLKEAAKALETKNLTIKSPSVAARIGDLLSAATRLEKRTFSSAASEAMMGKNQAALSGGIY